MKTIFFFITLCTLTLSGVAQQDLFGELTGKYADNDGFSASKITSDMFDLYIKKRNIDEQSPVFDALKNLDNILVVSQSNPFSANAGESKSDGPALEMHKEMLNYYAKNNFSLFKTDKQMGEDVKVFLKKNEEKIESLALVTHSQTGTSLVELQGNIDLANVSQLNQAMNLRGLENLYKINNGPVPFFLPGSDWTPERIEEMVAHQRELDEKHHKLSKEQQEKLEKQARAMAEKQIELVEKHRELAEKYKRYPIFLNPPGSAGTVYYINGKKSDDKAIKNISPDDIESIEVIKAKKEGEKDEIRIKTK